MPPVVLYGMQSAHFSPTLLLLKENLEVWYKFWRMADECKEECSHVQHTPYSPQHAHAIF